MSRIGKKPIAIGSGVKVNSSSVEGGTRVAVEGPKGKLDFDFRSEVSISVEDDQVLVTRSDDEAFSRSYHGTARSLLANMVQAGVALLVLMTVILIAGFSIPATALLLPIVWTPFMVIVLGLAMIFASLGVFVRDIGQVLGFLMTILLFGSTILFPSDMLPELLRPWLMLNPLTVIVDQSRAVLLWGELPDWRLLGWYSLVALTVFWLGSWWFLRTRSGFADVM